MFSLICWIFLGVVYIVECYNGNPASWIVVWVLYVSVMLHKIDDFLDDLSERVK